MYIIVIEWDHVSPQIITRETYDQINERFTELQIKTITEQLSFKRMTMYDLTNNIEIKQLSFKRMTMHDLTDNIEIKSYVGNY